MTNQVERWRDLAFRLGFEVVAPATIQVGDATVSFTALLPQFGGKNGMIADPEWEAISPFAEALWNLGYGFSTVEIGSVPDDDSIKEMLRDWSWSGGELKPSWL
jgi:hypothetical protein